MARIGINGFGRIGRYLVRLMAERNEFPVVINARADNASLAHLFKYDSVHHTFKGTVGHDENGIIINGTHIAVTRCKPNEWQWKDYGVDLVVESTGTIKKRAGLAEHMACGAKKVIMSAPVSDADITIVMGVNDGLYDPAKHDVVSSASSSGSPHTARQPADLMTALLRVNISPPADKATSVISLTQHGKKASSRRAATIS